MCASKRDSFSHDHRATSEMRFPDRRSELRILSPRPAAAASSGGYRPVKPAKMSTHLKPDASAPLQFLIPPFTSARYYLRSKCELCSRDSRDTGTGCRDSSTVLLGPVGSPSVSFLVERRKVTYPPLITYFIYQSRPHCISFFKVYLNYRSSSP